MTRPIPPSTAAQPQTPMSCRKRGSGVRGRLPTPSYSPEGAAHGNDVTELDVTRCGDGAAGSRAERADGMAVDVAYFSLPTSLLSSGLAPVVGRALCPPCGG